LRSASASTRRRGAAREEKGEQNDRADLAERGAGDGELANWTFGYTRVLQDGDDQAQRGGDENDPDEQRALDDTRCVKHDTDDQSEQRAQSER
jgi:hypothetical protein